MTFKCVIQVLDFLDDPAADGKGVSAFLAGSGVEHVSWKRIEGDKGHTDFVKALIPGLHGKTRGGSSPTLGIIGRLGGIGARPGVVGFVSDGDGAATALTVATKLGIMSKRGDRLDGDVIVTTHICPNAPTIPHEPVSFMGSPVDMRTMNEHEVAPDMDAIIAVDTTKGNHVINHRGFAISPTVKDGWILRVSEDLLRIMSVTTGLPPVTFPVTMQDITPYGNGVFHVNSILQPATATHTPVVGVAITTVSAVPGCATGASHPPDIDEAARFCIEVAKAFGANKCQFYDPEEYQRLLDLYGLMSHLRTLGAECSRQEAGA